jgi:hypothetical protein
MIKLSGFNKKSQSVFSKQKLAQWVVKRIGWKNSFKIVRFMAQKKLDGRLQKVMKLISK